jgi:hypothetical protein
MHTDENIDLILCVCLRVSVSLRLSLIEIGNLV